MVDEKTARKILGVGTDEFYWLSDYGMIPGHPKDPDRPAFTKTLYSRKWLKSLKKELSAVDLNNADMQARGYAVEVA